MITDAANDFAASLLQRAKEHKETAKSYAVQYASDDNPHNKAMFEKNSQLCDLYRILHGDACRAMHAVESEMRDTITRSAT